MEATDQEHPLLKAATALVAGALTVQDLWRTLLRDAGEELLGWVATAHVLPYDGLVSAHMPRLLERYTSMEAPAECRASARGGKRCRKLAAVNGLCGSHAKAAADDASKRRRTEAYLEARRGAGTLLQALVTSCAETRVSVPPADAARLDALLV